MLRCSLLLPRPPFAVPPALLPVPIAFASAFAAFLLMPLTSAAALARVLVEGSAAAVLTVLVGSSEYQQAYIEVKTGKQVRVRTKCY